MPHPRNTERLRDLMKTHGLSIEQVAELLKRSHQTVRTWRSINPQSIPDHMLELLETKLAQREVTHG